MLAPARKTNGRAEILPYRLRCTRECETDYPPARSDRREAPMLESKWDAEDFVARLDAGEFDGRISAALLELTSEQLREVEWILLHTPTPGQEK